MPQFIVALSNCIELDDKVDGVDGEIIVTITELVVPIHPTVLVTVKVYVPELVGI